MRVAGKAIRAARSLKFSTKTLAPRTAVRNHSYVNDITANDEAPFDASLPMMLYRVLDSIMPHYRALFAEYGLTEQQWRVLRTLWAEDGLSSIELARRTLLPAASLVGVLDRLEKKGLILRLRSVEDRRIVFAKPTPEGRKLERRIAPRLLEIHQSVRACVSADQWTALESILKQFENGPVLTKDAAQER